MIVSSTTGEILDNNYRPPKKTYGHLYIGGNLRTIIAVILSVLFLTYVLSNFQQGNQIRVIVNGESRVVERPESLQSVGLMGLLLLCSQNPAAVTPESFKSIQSFFNTELELAPNAKGCQITGAEIFQGFNKCIGTLVVAVLSVYNVLTYVVSFVGLVIS